MVSKKSVVLIECSAKNRIHFELPSVSVRTASRIASNCSRGLRPRDMDLLSTDGIDRDVFATVYSIKRERFLLK